MFALKRIDIQHLKGRERQEALREVRLLRLIDHPHIIKYYASFLEAEQLYIVTELAERGDLEQLITSQRAKKKYLSEPDIWSMLWQLTRAVLYLHARQIIHRDIKTLNIFIAQD